MLIHYQKKFNRQVLLFIISTVLVLFFIFSIIDRQYIQEMTRQDYHHELEQFTASVYSDILLKTENIKALASRTMIRRELYKWHQRQISLEDLRAFTSDKYRDGASVYENIIYAARYDRDGREICLYASRSDIPPRKVSGQRILLRDSEDLLILYMENEIVHKGESIGFDCAAFSISKCKFPSQYLENIRIADDAEGHDSSLISLEVGDTGFFLTADISESMISHRLGEHYRKLLKWIILLCLLLLAVAYVTIVHFSRRLIDVIDRLNSQMIQNERYAAIGQVSSGLTHDFGNRLQVISGYSELMMKEEMSPSAEQRLQSIRDETWKASDIINQLYRFSVDSIDRNELIPVRDFLQESVHDFARSSDLTLNLDLKVPADLSVPLDKEGLNAAIKEFLINASEADASAVELSAFLSVNESDTYCMTCKNEIGGEWLCLSLKDNGSGFHQDISEHALFEPFFTTKGAPHSGLGLTRLYGLVHQHQGHVVLNNPPEQGFGLLLYFPLKS